MEEAAARSAIRPLVIVDHPIFAMLLPIPIVCFVGAVITDLAYQGSNGNLLWVNFSSWLIAAGLLFGAIAAVVALIDLLRGVAGARGGAGWACFLLLLAAWIVELVNALIHARDGWTAVVPLGLTLSVIGAVLILVSGWLWQTVRYRAAGDVR
ncbi:MAG TPA: DUF2231 domain-containing protein [Sphingomicrobium sp.]|jgi:uncharacterized membrane protein|nr:DUF2231 domain-containing protein [Sphingomicrobium sp.]